MTEATAIQQLRDYAGQWGVDVRHVRTVKAYRAWWYFGYRDFQFLADTGDGQAEAWVSRFYGGVATFDYRPSDPNAFMLPLWAAFPQYTSVTMGWRQGEGEDYKYRWHAFYRGLTDEGRRAYQARFPEPTDEERAWKDYYKDIADVPAGKANPVADFIIGRV